VTAFAAVVGRSDVGHGEQISAAAPTTASNVGHSERIGVEGLWTGPDVGHGEQIGQQGGLAHGIRALTFTASDIRLPTSTIPLRLFAGGERARSNRRTTRP
jgi:hypothetical protein